VISLRSSSLARAEIEKPATFNAPLFRSVAERLDTGGRWVVLDLGAAHRQTISFFSQYRCRLDVADLGEGLEALNAESDPVRLAFAAEALLPMRHDDTTDIVLCWDVLNYLERPALTALMSCVAARARPGTLMHALIVYSDRYMPAQPGNYLPLDDCNLFDLSACHDERPAPQYTPVDLESCLKGYVMDRVVLLGNGMQEFLFRL
jgi:hypothetical protein